MYSKKAKGIIAALLCSALILGACTDKEVQKDTEVVSETKEFTDFMEKFLGNLEKGDVETATKSMERVLETKKFDKDELSTIIDAYIYGLSLKANELNSTITDYHPQIVKFLDEEKDFLNEEDVNSIEDEKFKEFAQAIYDNYLILYSINDEHSLSPDINYVLSTYDEYMTDTLKDYLIIFNYVSSPIAYEDSMDALLSAFETNINLLQEYLDKYNADTYDSFNEKTDPYYINRAAGDLNLYYNLFFGLSDTSLLNEDETYKKEVIDIYKKVLKETKNNVLKSKLEVVLPVIESDKHKTKMSTDLYNEISDLIKITDDEGNFIIKTNVNNEENAKVLKDANAALNLFQVEMEIEKSADAIPNTTTNTSVETLSLTGKE